MSEFLGVSFQPYVGRWTGTAPDAKTPFWNSYTQQDIVTMLEAIATQFNKISTYGMGYAGYYQPTQPWNQVDSNCHVAGAAAQLNQQMGKIAIEVAQGIYQQSDTALQQAEVEALRVRQFPTAGNPPSGLDSPLFLPHRRRTVFTPTR
jgi:hypothetical protein